MRIRRLLYIKVRRGTKPFRPDAWGRRMRQSRMAAEWTVYGARNLLRELYERR